jgi:eukaryotic-like serine/threonine-protein kinase
MSLSTGDIIDGKYRIVRLIGEGGMGAVYEAENMRIHRKVAIKVLHAGVAQTGEAVSRFEREAQAAGRIGSEHIVEVLDMGNLSSGDRYMVMEFMDGDALSGRIRDRTRLTPGEIYPIMHQLLDALGAAHGAGIIHRDLKPDNVYLLKSRGGKADFVKLLDFGISKFNQLSGDSGFSMTRTGAVMGTPYYMAPEQAKGARDLDHRVDLYAAGVILYEAITGEVPFNADTFNELLFKIVLEAAKPVEQVVPNTDPNFAAIVNKSMAREPGQRFQTAREFQQALEQWAAGAGPHFAAAMNASVQAPGGAPAYHQPALTGPYAAVGTGQYAAANTAQHAPVGPGQYAAVGTAPQPGAPGHALGTGTPGNWANTGAYAPAEAIPKKSSAGLFIGLAVVGVLLLGGGAFVAMSLSHGKEDAAAAAGKLEAEKAGAEKAKAEQGEKAAQDAAAKASAEAEKAKAEAETMKGEAEKAKAEAAAKNGAKVAAVAPAPRGASKPAPAVAAKPEPKPEPKPAAPAPAAAPASTGRRIRTTL